MPADNDSFQTAGMRVIGGAKLRREMKQAGVDVTDLQEAHKNTAKIVETRARGTVPTDSGKLASTMRSAGTKTMSVIRAGNNRKTNAGVPYAAPIHWGWPARNIEPQPWLVEAAADTEPEWFADYTKSIDEIIEKIKGAPGSV